jgi:hypothetical protein
MGIYPSLALLALRQLLNGACAAAGAPPAGDAVVDFLTDYLTDHSQRLTVALHAATSRAWRALEIALAGAALTEKRKQAFFRALNPRLCDAL